jgi:aryl-alcohol dehydrogenase
MHQIRAAVLRRGGALAIETLKLEGPRPDEVLVLLSATGICHTDLNFMEDWNGPPVVLGHEGAGVVLEVGKDLKSVRPGDHVVLSYQSCGRCGPCRQGHPTACRHFWEANFGFRRLDGSNALEGSGVSGHFFGQSSFASHCLATERNLVKVPPDLPLELLAPLGCGLQTGAGTVLNSLKVPKEASIAIFGTGAVGLAAVMAARLTGADPIIGVDLNPARLELALTLGASRVIDNRREEVISQIQQITGGGVDYVLETTGDQEMHQLGLEVLNPRGTLALIAHPGGGGPVPGGRRALGIIQGDAVPQSFIPRLIALYQAGQFPYDRLLRYYDFAEIHRALAEARRGDAIKPVLRFGEAA